MTIVLAGPTADQLLAGHKPAAFVSGVSIIPMREHSEQEGPPIAPFQFNAAIAMTTSSTGSAGFAPMYTTSGM